MSDVCAALRAILSERFSDEELRTLAADLAVDYADLPGEGKAGKARELVGWFERHRQLGRLVSGIEAARPDIEFPGGVIIGCERVRIQRVHTRRRAVMDTPAARSNAGIERQVERLADGMEQIRNDVSLLRTDVRLLQSKVTDLEEFVRHGPPMSRSTTLALVLGIALIVVAAALIFVVTLR